MSDELKQYCDYMRKEAGGPNPFQALLMAYSSAGAHLTGEAVKAGLALAALAGGASGFAVSQLSSPGKRDYKNIQREHIRGKLEREVAKGKRESALDTLKSQAIADKPKPKSMRL